MYIEKIKLLKQKKKALILAHYYQSEAIKNLADYVGDSYYLSKIAKDSKNDFIIFCGVSFMAESAKIMSPNKRVFLPVKKAGCEMAEMVDIKGLKKLKKQYEDVTLVTYINSNTQVKSISDVIVTSSNAEKIVSKIKSKNIIFSPDRNLGSYIGEKFQDKNIILWQGYCPIHEKVDINQLINFKKRYKDGTVLTHPECSKQIRDISNFVGSTTAIIDEAKKYSEKDILIVTEEGIISDLKKYSNNRYHTPKTKMICNDMKKISLEDLYLCLCEERFEIFIEKELIYTAKKALDKMHILAN